jgi:alkylation response protein AidB-like acyl-CoA dehydrogenase
MSLPLVIRRTDFGLTEDERSFPDSVNDYLRTVSTRERVSAAEPLGYDADLWKELTHQGAVEAGLSEDTGGAGSLVQATLIAEAIGRHTAPVPYTESVVVARLLARVGSPESLSLSEQVASGQTIVGFASASGTGGWPQLVSTGAIADIVVGMVDGDLVSLARGGEVAQVPVQGALPTGWWGPQMATATTILAGDDAAAAFRRARDEYLTLTASALAGLGAATLDQAAVFAKDRTTRGVPIGSLQGVSHPLVTCKVAVEGARQTARKAAWFGEFESEANPKLPAVAFIAAARAADNASRAAMHVNGGMGVMVDSESARYLLRSKSWAAVVARVPDVQLELAEILRSPRYQNVIYPSML